MHLILFGLNRRQSENLLLMIGQLVLIAYLFQVAALDHWHTEITNVTGVAGSSAHDTSHVDHCHGAPSSCAGAGDGFAQVSADQVVHLPSPNTTLVLVADSGMTRPDDAFIAIAPEPPQATA